MSLFRQLLIANSRKKKRKFYCELEYLESTGTQWIDTGYTLNQNCAVEMSIYAKDKNASVFGSSSSASINSFVVFVGTASHENDYVATDFYNYNTSRASCNSSSLNKRVKVECNKNYRRITDEATSTVLAENTNVISTTFTTPTTARLFASTNMWSGCRNFIGNIYYCKIWDNDILVRDFIPVLDWDMKPCMYDKVSGELFRNKVTGEDFLYDRQIHPVEYLESTGTQYINTGIKGTTTTIGVDLAWEFSNADSNMCIFSSRSGQVRNTFTLFWLKSSQNRLRFDASGQVYLKEPVNTSPNQLYRFVYKSPEGNVVLYNLTNGNSQTQQVGPITALSTNPLYLFASRDTAILPSYIKMYYYKLYDGDTLIRDFIPAVDEKGIGFMFDRVTHTIYDNAGTGAFSYPPVELEYLEGTGSQYIDTGLNPTDDYGYRIKNTYKYQGGEQCAIGAMDGGNRFVGVYTGGYAVSGGWGSFVDHLKAYYKFTDDTIWDVSCNYKNDRKIILNNEELKDVTDIHITGTVNNTLYLFARHYGTNVTKIIGKIYGAEITNGQEVVATYVPVFKDGKIGMYDKVSGVLYENNGTGAFIAGRIIEKEYE